MLPMLTQPSFLAAHLKQIPLDFDVARSPFLKDSPYLGRLLGNHEPILQANYDNGESILLTQSLSMLDLLEDSYPGRRPLIPPVTDMTARCKVKDLAALVLCGIEPKQEVKVLHALEQDSVAWARKFLASGMRAFEDIAKKCAGLYSVGDELSIADICLVTMVQASYKYGIIFDQSQYKSGVTRYPTIQRIVTECEMIPSFMQAGIPKESSGERWRKISREPKLLSYPRMD